MLLDDYLKYLTLLCTEYRLTTTNKIIIDIYELEDAFTTEIKKINLQRFFSATQSSYPLL